MPKTDAIPQRVIRADPPTEQEVLRILIQDLQGVERLQQMQGQLLREMIRQVKQLQHS